LFRQIGQLKVEVTWLKKILGAPVEKKRQETEPMNPKIGISRRCVLMDLLRSSFCYKPEGEDEYNLMLMRMINEKYTKYPFNGVRRMPAWLRSRGY